MAGERVLYFRVNLRDLFPLNDPLVPPLLQLMPAVNDLRTLQKAWLYAHSRVGTTRSEEEIVKAESGYLFRLTCATAHEAGLAFQDLRQLLSASSAKGTVDAMPEEARQAFRILENIFAADFHKNTNHGKTLARIRSAIYHYPTPKECRSELERHDELGTFIIGSRIGASRYLLADDLQVQILETALGGRFEDQVRRLMDLTIDVARCFGDFVDGMVGMYVQAHRESIVERIEDTVDLGLLWNITPERAQRGPGNG